MCIIFRVSHATSGGRAHIPSSEARLHEGPQVPGARVCVESPALWREGCAGECTPVTGEEEGSSQACDSSPQIQAGAPALWGGQEKVLFFRLCSFWRVKI